MKDFTDFKEFSDSFKYVIDNLEKLNIFSIKMIAEGTLSPEFHIKYLDGKEEILKGTKALNKIKELSNG